MKRYASPKGFFDPLELALLERVLESAWAEITRLNLIDLAKDDALKRAVCLKLFSLIRTRLTDPDLLTESLLAAIRTEPQDANCPLF